MNGACLVSKLVSTFLTRLAGVPTGTDVQYSQLLKDLAGCSGQIQPGQSKLKSRVPHEVIGHSGRTVLVNLSDLGQPGGGGVGEQLLEAGVHTFAALER